MNSMLKSILFSRKIYNTNYYKLIFQFVILSFIVLMNSTFSQVVVNFGYTGTVQNFEVPCGVTSINVKAWGAGGSGGGTDTYSGAIGGGGGYVTTTLAVTPGQTLSIIVGGGALGGGPCQSNSPGGAGGWGNGQIAGARGGNAGSQGCSGGGGGGGGGTGIFLAGNPLVIAGGGGGGSGGGNQSSGAAGGAGGQNGFGVNGCTPGVTGANGVGNGTNGGDRGNADGAGGGGGGGGYRGGTGGSSPNACDCGGCGGGGGSNFSSGTGTTLTNGAGQNPGNANDPSLPSGLARGGVSSVQGGNGYLIISYNGGTVTSQFSVSNVCQGISPTFTNTSTSQGAPISSYSWNFGDGSPVSTAQNPSYTYPNPGTYTVSLTVSNGFGCDNTSTQQITIHPKPTANFSLDVPCRNPNEAVNLINTSTFANQNSDVVSWISSDAYSSNTTNFNHIFANSGTFTVKLIITSINGCKDSITQTVNNFYKPQMQSNASNICFGSNFTLSSASSIETNEPLTNSWIVNQGTPLTGSPINYSYTQPGNYNVVLITTTQNGCADTLNQNLIIYPKPIANFTYNEQCINSPMTFTNSSVYFNTQNTNAWIFNSNMVASTANYSFPFPNPGNTTLTLVIGDVYGNLTCYDTISKTFFVHDIPITQFSGDLDICLGDVINLTNGSSISTTEQISFAWSVNDTNVTSNTNFNAPSTSVGTFVIGLTTTSAFGCNSSTLANLIVNAIPQAPEIIATVPNCPGDEISLCATAEAGSTILWSGPLNYSSTNFCNAFPFQISQIGDYSAYVISQYGCASPISSVLTSIVNIYSFDDFNFPNVISPNGDLVNDEFNVLDYFKTCDDFTMNIYNRWGNIVFVQDQSSTTGFKGVSQSGKELEDGIYFYKLSYFSGGEQKKGEKSGFIHVVR